MVHCCNWFSSEKGNIFHFRFKRKSSFPFTLVASVIKSQRWIHLIHSTHSAFVYNLFNQSIALFNSIMIGPIQKPYLTQGNGRSMVYHGTPNRGWTAHISADAETQLNRRDSPTSRTSRWNERKHFLRVPLALAATPPTRAAAMADWHFYCVHLKWVPLLAQHAHCSGYVRRPVTVERVNQTDAQSQRKSVFQSRVDWFNWFSLLHFACCAIWCEEMPRLLYDTLSLNGISDGAEMKSIHLQQKAWSVSRARGTLRYINALSFSSLCARRCQNALAISFQGKTAVVTTVAGSLPYWSAPCFHHDMHTFRLAWNSMNANAICLDVFFAITAHSPSNWRSIYLSGKFPQTTVPMAGTCVQHSLQSAMHEANEKICQLFTYDISEFASAFGECARLPH